ncbi:MAG TPA: hypothetical protein VMZ91_02325 [Candidatus Paceibacterota bacterium]|nr:hypothetical protein [Candidatus Paceibacterota bacterium]
MNFQDWYNEHRKSQGMNCRLELSDVREAWKACKKEVLKIIKSKYPNKYPKHVKDLVYRDGWEDACMIIEGEVEKL